MPDQFKPGDTTTVEGKPVRIVAINPDGTAEVEFIEEKTLGGFGQNVLKSGGRMAEDLFNAVTSPIQTGKGILKLAKGAVELAIPGEQGDEDSARAVGQFYKDRYGGVENIKDTLYNDPVGAVADLSTVLGGGAGVLKGVGALSKSANVAKAGRLMTAASDLTNPVRAVTAPVKALGHAAGTGLAQITVRPGTQLAKQAGVGDKLRIAREVAEKGLWNTERASQNLDEAIQRSKDLVASSPAPPVPRSKVAVFDNTLDELLKRQGSQQQGLSDLAALERNIVSDFPDQIPLGDLYDFNKHANREANATFRKASMEMPGGAKPITGLGWKEAADRSRNILRDEIGAGMKGAQRDVQTAMLANGAVTTAKARPHALTRLLAVGAGASMRSPQTAAAMLALDSPTLGAMGGAGLWHLGNAADKKALVRAALLARLRQEKGFMPPEP